MGQRSRHRERAIAALLSSRTIPEAAAAAGLNTRTLERWLCEEEDFKRAYRDAPRQVVEQSIASLQEATGEAVETLRRNLKCGSAPTEVRAAVAILDRSFSAIELLDLESRISALEADGLRS